MAYHQVNLTSGNPNLPALGRLIDILNFKCLLNLDYSFKSLKMLYLNEATVLYILFYQGGLSRGGLLYPDRPGGPRNDYAGHVFWDMDTWVMPPMLMFHPEMARYMIEARTRVLPQAKANAKAKGLEGAKFPWEQASTGLLYNFYS
jgi:hypothetical protein